MIIEKNGLKLSDDTNSCDERSYFVKTAQNQRYFNKLFKYKAIISAYEAKKMLGIENIKIVGITGTNGKTTTAAALYSFLLDLGKKVAFQGTRGCFVGEKQVAFKSLTTPPILETLHHLCFAKDAGCEYFIMEVSSHAIVQDRIDGLEFALKIFTNLSQDHLDFHVNMSEYAKVKSSFFSDESLKLMNADDKHICFNSKNLRTYAVESNATYKIGAYSLKDGIDAVLNKGTQTLHFNSPLRGYFNLYNVTAAIAALDILESPKNLDFVENFSGVEGRMEIVHEKPLVIVDFAHTPDGFEKVLDSLKSERLVVLFGAGGDRDKSKRSLMGKIASRFGLRIYISSDNPRSEEPMDIIEDIKAGVNTKKPVYIEVDRKKAIHEALRSLHEDEILIILGKGDEIYQEIKGIKYPFDDREIVREFYAQNY